MHRISKKFHRGGGGLQEVVRVYQAIEKVGHCSNAPRNRLTTSCQKSSKYCPRSNRSTLRARS
jgi:hypothetical protein